MKFGQQFKHKQKKRRVATLVIYRHVAAPQLKLGADVMSVSKKS